MIRQSVLSKVNEMDLIIDKTNKKGALWLGNLKAAQNISKLKENNIRTIITVANNIILNYKAYPSMRHKIYKIEDSAKTQIIDFFEEINDEIDSGLMHGSVLVHCAAGISRSSACVIAFIMNSMKWTYEKTFYFVKEKRLAINPNPGFKKQLIQYSQILFCQNQFSHHQPQGSMESETGQLLYTKSLTKLRKQLYQSPSDIFQQLSQNLVKQSNKRVDSLNRTSTPEERQIYRQQMAKKLLVNQFSGKNSFASVNSQSEQRSCLQSPEKQPSKIKALLSMYKRVEVNVLESERIK